MVSLTLDSPCAEARGIPGLAFIGEFQIPPLQNLPSVGDPPFGGISGIDYDPSTGTYIAISDSQTEPRFYKLTIDFDTSGISSVTIEDVWTIPDSDGGGFSAEPDPESIRFTPSGSLVWASEGGVSSGIDPFVREMGPNGQPIRELTLPDKFLPFRGRRGVANNRAFESLAISSDGKRIIAGTENALVQDGSVATTLSGSPSRILEFDFDTGLPMNEFVYQVEPVPTDSMPPGGLIANGLVELLAIDDNNFLAMERSFATGVGWGLRVYNASTADATDVSSFESLPDDYVPLSKTLLLDFDSLGITLDNLEGVTYGPVIHGRQTIVFVSDDNFGELGPAYTQFLVFQVVPEPAGASLAIAAVVQALCGARRVPLLTCSAVRTLLP